MHDIRRINMHPVVKMQLRSYVLKVLLKRVRHLLPMLLRHW
jgi:hypothetical protein